MTRAGPPVVLRPPGVPAGPVPYSGFACQPAGAHRGIQWLPRFSKSCFSAVKAAR